MRTRCSHSRMDAIRSSKAEFLLQRFFGVHFEFFTCLNAAGGFYPPAYSVSDAEFPRLRSRDAHVEADPVTDKKDAQ